MGQYDLALGPPGVRSVITDLKTGLERPGHPEEIRYYALLETLKNQVPPERVATYVYDVEFPTGGSVTTSVPPEFQGFAYVLDGEASFGANERPAHPPQLVLGPGEDITVTDTAPGTRFMLMAWKPYGEAPEFNGPYVD